VSAVSARGQQVWAANSYLGLPSSWDHGVYTSFWALLFPLVYFAACVNKHADGTREIEALGGVPVQQLVAAVVAYSPVAVALLLAKLSGDRMHWRWPFQKERALGTFGLFLALGWLACVKPVYDATLWIC
jgi:cytochrome c biogenesis protein CcdA